VLLLRPASLRAEAEEIQACSPQIGMTSDRKIDDAAASAGRSEKKATSHEISSLMPFGEAHS